MPIRGSSPRANTAPQRAAAVSIVFDHLRDLALLFQAHEPLPATSYRAPPEYLLDHAHEFGSARLTRDESCIVVDALDMAGEPAFRACYANAQRLVVADETGTIRYHEGYAFSDSGLVAAHAWASIKGKVLDLTWEDHRGRWVFGVLPPGWEYVGVEIDRDYLVERRAALPQPGSLLVDDTFEFARLLRWKAEQAREAVAVADLDAEDVVEHLVWEWAARRGLIDDIPSAEWGRRHAGTDLAGDDWIEEHERIVGVLDGDFAGALVVQGLAETFVRTVRRG